MAPNLTLQEHIITHTLWHILDAEMQNNFIAIPYLSGQQNFKITSRLRICLCTNTHSAGSCHCKSAHQSCQYITS